MSVKTHERVHFLLTLKAAGKPLTARDLMDRANTDATLEMFEHLPLVGPRQILSKLQAMRHDGLVSSLHFAGSVEWIPTACGVRFAKQFVADHEELAA